MGGSAGEDQDLGGWGTAHRHPCLLSYPSRFSALHHAALGGSLELIALLLEAQATVDIKDSNGETPVEPPRCPLTLWSEFWDSRWTSITQMRRLRQHLCPEVTRSSLVGKVGFWLQPCTARPFPDLTQVRPASLPLGLAPL